MFYEKVESSAELVERKAGRQSFASPRLEDFLVFVVTHMTPV
jgi:hypothetical protein|tara:strand:- start:1361 stop:1486 length:126 start_codon:yes stop_codon:yes gene_type:complete